MSSDSSSSVCLHKWRSHFLGAHLEFLGRAASEGCCGKLWAALPWGGWERQEWRPNFTGGTVWKAEHPLWWRAAKERHQGSSAWKSAPGMHTTRQPGEDPAMSSSEAWAGSEPCPSSEPLLFLGLGFFQSISVVLLLSPWWSLVSSIQNTFSVN